MRRIANGTQVPTLPAVPAASGTPGFATPGSAPGGIEATIWDPHTWNIYQEELCGIVEAAGLTLDNSGADRAQLLAALYAFFPGMAAANRVVGTPGYIKLPGGLILQWCVNLVTGSDGAGQMNYTWTYPVAFPTATLGVSFMPTFIGSATNDPQITLNAHSATQALVVGKGFPPSATAAFSGFVIGH